MDIPVRHLPHDGQECPSYIVPGNLCTGAYGQWDCHQLCNYLPF